MSQSENSTKQPQKADCPSASCSPGGRCRGTYREECAKRWDGDALRNARGNWETFEEHHADIVAVLEPYVRDSGCRDIAGKYHNPDHTLTGWLWKCSEAKENWWIWDFCEHYQKCHLRRGIIQYCKMVIAEIKAAQDPAPGHPEITLDYETPAIPRPRSVHGVCGNNPCTCAESIPLANVKEHAPPLAGASVETGGEG